jgi:hypothetical protein
MLILSDLIAHLRGKDHPVKEVLTGAYWTGVVSGGCGLASTFRHEGHPHRQGVRDVGRLTEKKRSRTGAVCPIGLCDGSLHRHGRHQLPP